MQLANCLVALGGDRTNTVPKWGITPAEVAILLAIHGDDAVFDIEVTDEVCDRRGPEEMDRLAANYPAKDEDGRMVLFNVFPGRGVTLPPDFSDLGLVDDLYRAAPAKAPEPAKAAKPRKAAKAPEPEPATASVFDEDDEDPTS